MNHPDHEEWVPFICHESDPETRKRLAQHLEQCPDCAREVAGWRRSLGRLDQWTLPKPQGRILSLFPPGVKWALAAALVLGVGVLIGRVTTPAPWSIPELRGQIESSLRSSFEARLDEALRQVQAENSVALTRAEERWTQASAVEQRRAWRDLLAVLEAARAEDGRALRTALQAMQERHDTEFVALRKDLETLASMTDREIREARFRLVQLAAYENPTP
jgi:hypothetical protein